ncbi:MAG: toxin-antitoxin system YwqK family antitoxin [Chrysiogenales bacterium]|nr:MAG: toxin-antitoxin system YwqK family antitoxin [Chrysiogenales bacterium]
MKPIMWTLQHHRIKEKRSMVKIGILLVSFCLILSAGCVSLERTENTPAFDILSDIVITDAPSGKPHITRWSDGSLMATGIVLSGKKNGLWKVYYPGTSGSLLKAEVTFTNDIANGKLKEYYASGRIRSETDYRNGIRNGRHMLYYETGVGRIEEYYRDGKKNGKSFEYYENGFTRENAFFKDGVRDGMSNSFHRSGKRKAMGRYTAGKKNGTWEHYTEEGILKSRGSYVNNKKSGVWSYYDATGKKEEKNHD